MLKKLQNAVVEGRLCLTAYNKTIGCIINKVLQKLDKLLASNARRYMFKREIVQKNKILFVTTRGSYNCNPRFIADEIIKQKLPWELVWTARIEDYDNIKQYPPELRLVLRGSYEYYKEAAQARVLIDNAMSSASMGLYKKPDQVFIQTWHGSIGLKRFETNSDKEWIKVAKNSGSQTDYCLSNSTFETELFYNTFWKSATILEVGHARNDILLTDDAAKIAALKCHVQAELNIPPDVKIALYAPTFRDSRDLSPYGIDYEALKNVLEQRFGGTWVILSRLHFEIKKTLKKRKIVYPKCVIDATDYPDIQDLLAISDLGITDYSSWICDFVLTRRPAFFFATDLESYYSERGFYYPLESTPFPLAQSNLELHEKILTFNEETYRNECDEFIKDKGCVDDGHAAKRIVEMLKKIMGE